MPTPNQYNPNIPQPNDLISVSQGQILNNFGANAALIDVNHYDFAAVPAGKHFIVGLPVQPNSPPLNPTTGLAYSFAGGEIGLYNFNNSASGNNELYIHNSLGNEVPMTASAQAATGWSYIPSGIIFKWGVVTLSGAGVATVNLNASAPNFTNVFHISMTYNTASVPAIPLKYTLSGLTATFTGTASLVITYMALGN